MPLKNKKLEREVHKSDENDLADLKFKKNFQEGLQQNREIRVVHSKHSSKLNLRMANYFDNNFVNSQKLQKTLVQLGRLSAKTLVLQDSCLIMHHLVRALTRLVLITVNLDRFLADNRCSYKNLTR